MLTDLNFKQREWVEKTLVAMTTEECIGHLICPEDRNYTPEKWAEIVCETTKR